MKTKLPATAHKTNTVCKIYNTRTKLYWSGKRWTKKGKAYVSSGAALNAIGYHAYSQWSTSNKWQDCVLIEYSTLISNVSEIRIVPKTKTSKIRDSLVPLSLLTDIEFEG